MAKALRKALPIKYLTRVDPSKISAGDWFLNPDVSAVIGHPERYWSTPSDPAVLMSQAERDAVDAQIIDDQKDGELSKLNAKDLLAAVALVMLDEINLLRGLHGNPQRTIANLKAAIRSKL